MLELLRIGIPTRRWYYRGLNIIGMGDQHLVRAGKEARPLPGLSDV